MNSLVRVAVIGAFVACKTKEPQPLVDSGAPDVLPSASAAATVTDPVADSIAFLIRLDKLMEGYVPAVPLRDNAHLLRCLTTHALENDPELRSAGNVLISRREKALKERDRKIQQLYVLSTRIDIDWASKRVLIPEIKSCWADGILQYDECCGADGECGPQGWRVDVPAERRFLYSQAKEPPTTPPELMVRVESAKLKPLERFSCLVEDVRTESMLTLVANGEPDVFSERTLSFAMVDCEAPKPMLISLRVSGDVRSLNAGDVVSIPLANSHRPEGAVLKIPDDRRLRWIVDGDITELRVDHAASCPPITEIVAASKK
jgi:hypothetical protein